MNNKTEKKKRKFLSDEEKMEIIKLHHYPNLVKSVIPMRSTGRRGN